MPGLPVSARPILSLVLWLPPTLPVRTHWGVEGVRWRSQCGERMWESSDHTSPRSKLLLQTAFPPSVIAVEGQEAKYDIQGPL